MRKGFLVATLLATVLATTLGTSSLSGPPLRFDLEDLLTTSRQDPCALFEESDDFVRFYVDMEMEGSEIAMRVPKVFLEDRFDHQNYAHHRAQLFRVMIDNFLPVTRAQTGAFNKALPWPRGHQRHMHFLVQDVVDLHGILNIHLDLLLQDPPVSYQDVFEADPHDFGLQKLRSVNPRYNVKYRQEALIARADDGSLQTVMTCNMDGSVPYPGCSQWFRSHGLDVKLTFRKPHLSEWKQMQEDVDRFLGCATSSKFQ